MAHTGQANIRGHNDVPHVLVVDDEASIREVLSDFMSMEDWDVTTAASGEDALTLLQDRQFDAVVTDLKMGRVGGIEVLEAARERDPHVAAIVMTGFGTVESAIESMKKGAFDYVLKPFKVPDLLKTVSRALDQRKLQLENIELKEIVSCYDAVEQIGRSLSLDDVTDVLVDTARERLGCDALIMSLVPDERDSSETFAGRSTGDFAPLTMDVQRFWARTDLPPEARTLVEGLDAMRVVRALSQGEAVTLRSENAWKVTGDPELAEQNGLEAIVAFPLRGRDGVLGIMCGVAFHADHRFSEDRRKLLSMLASRGAAAIENARLYENLKETFTQTIQGLANILESKDTYTRGHSERVRLYAGMLAEALELSVEDVDRIKEAALLHDIGKISIRIEELNKPGPLTPSEYETFKSHTTRGKWLLEPITFLHNLIPAVYHHHERWDGEGYPLGLSEYDIPLDARIMALADSYDAMTSNRAYRRALPHEVAIEEINRNAGSQFDPELASIFVEAIERFKEGQRERRRRWTEILEKKGKRPAIPGITVPKKGR